MAQNEPIQNLIESALALPQEQRLALLDALHASLADDSFDHGPVEPSEEVASAWKVEIASRIADIEKGHVTTIPSAEAEKMIRSDAKPSV